MADMTKKNTAGNKQPFIAFANGKDGDVLRAFAASRQWPDSTIHSGDIKTATEYLKTNPSPAVLLVELPNAADAPGLLDALADVCDPDTKVITIGDVNEYSFYCWLMDIGIFSYLLKPLTEQMLESAYQKSENGSAQLKHGKAPGKVIAVVGARGGVGASAVALNLAGIMAEISHKNIALVDADPQEGTIALSLDIEPSRGLRDVLEKPERIDSLFIERVMQKPHKHLSIISAEESLTDPVHATEAAADALLRELREKCDVVVLDIPRHMTGFSRQCLKLSDHVVLVTEMSLASLRDTLRISDMMRDSLKLKPPVIVANRVGLAGKHEMQRADFEKGINAKLAQVIPFAPDAFMLVSAEIPAIKNKTHAAFKPLFDLLEQWLPDMKGKAAPAAPVKKSFTLFKKKGG